MAVTVAVAMAMAMTVAVPNTVVLGIRQAGPHQSLISRAPAW